MQPFVPIADPEEARAQVVSVFDTFGPPALLALVQGLRSGGFDGRSEDFDFLPIIADAIGILPRALSDRLGFPTGERSLLEPIERFMFNISKGDTPSNNERARTVVDWCEELLENPSVRVS